MSWSERAFLRRQAARGDNSALDGSADIPLRKQQQPVVGDVLQRPR
jgi:hypothetical protein